MWKRILINVAIVVVVLSLFLYWYRDTYSMGPAVEIEAGVEGATGEVLIATQGSTYKDALTRALVARLTAADLHVRVVDVRALHKVDPAGWDAVVVIHTWEMWVPEPNAAAFLERHREADNVIVLSTSGSGDMRLDSVDGISSASVVKDVPNDVVLILDRIKTLTRH